MNDQCQANGKLIVKGFFFPIQKKERKRKLCKVRLRLRL